MIGASMTSTFVSYMQARAAFEEKMVELVAVTGWTSYEADAMVKMHWVAHGGTVSSSADALIEQAKRGEFDGPDTQDR